MSTTRAVVEHHIEALETGDVDAVLEDYTEDSVLIVGSDVLRGLETLREVFGGALATMFKPGAHEFTLDSIQVDGEYGLITWHLRHEGGELPFASDTFHIRDGKILAQTGALYPGPAV